jgi:hypothetical protein
MMKTVKVSKNLITHSIAVRLALGQSFTLCFLATRSIATRLALGQSFALFFLAQV